jgi:CPA1 family monovalent cation:H+ antiporter
VLFLGLLEIALGGRNFEFSRFVSLFFREAAGGAALGLIAGLVVYWMLRSVDNYQVEILLSLALVAGGYALADALHLSGPIAMVTAGLLIGNHGRSFAMSRTTVEHLDLFWELVDEILNAMLFVLLGFEILVLSFTGAYLAAGLLLIPVVLLARLCSVGIPFLAFRRWRQAEPGTVRVLTWGGLRGGISVALALSLPVKVNDQVVPEREPLLVITYIVVVFSILVQGLSIGPLSRRWLGGGSRPPADEAPTW